MNGKTVACGVCLEEVPVDQIQTHVDTNACIGKVLVHVWKGRPWPVYVRAMDDIFYIDELPSVAEADHTRLLDLAERCVIEAGGDPTEDGRYPSNEELHKLTLKVFTEQLLAMIAELNSMTTEKLPEGITMPKRFKVSILNQIWFTEGARQARAGQAMIDESEMLQKESSAAWEAYKLGYDAGSQH